jgi:hypothetical protein
LRQAPVKALLQAAALPCLLFLLAGCSDGPRVVAVKGVALRGDQPVKNLLLTFYPANDGRPSTAMTDEQGLFELKHDKQTKGAIVGPHKVVVAFRPRNAKEEMELRAGTLKLHPDQDAITEKYGKLETTALSVEITKAEDNLLLKLD